MPGADADHIVRLVPPSAKYCGGRRLDRADRRRRGRVGGGQRGQGGDLRSILRKAGPQNNVVGIGAGIEWTNGRATGEPAGSVMVTHKVAPENLSKADMVPAKLQDMQTDVLAVGQPFAGHNAAAASDVGSPNADQKDPAGQGGYSVGHFAITAGTIGTCVYDILPGASHHPDARSTVSVFPASSTS